MIVAKGKRIEFDLSHWDLSGEELEGPIKKFIGHLLTTVYADEEEPYVDLSLTDNGDDPLELIVSVPFTDDDYIRVPLRDVVLQSIEPYRHGGPNSGQRTFDDPELLADRVAALRKLADDLEAALRP